MRTRSSDVRSSTHYTNRGKRQPYSAVRQRSYSPVCLAIHKNVVSFAG
jgi:hypothetical protein